MGVFLDSWNDLDPRIPIDVWIGGLAVSIHMILLIPIAIERFRTYQNENQLDSLRMEFILTNSLVFGIFSFGIASIMIVNKSDLERLDEFPYNMFVFFNLFLASSLSSVMAAIVLLRKYGSEIFRAIFHKCFSPAAQPPCDLPHISPNNCDGH